MSATDPAILQRLEAVVRTVFEAPSLAVEASLTMDQVPAWDSVGHMALIAAVEQAFGIRFSLAELVRVEDIGTLVSLIRDKLAG